MEHHPAHGAAQAFLPGFQDAVHESQRVFRGVLDAMAQPGRIVQLPRCPVGPWPLEPAAAAVALTLLDLDTLLWVQDDDEDAMGNYLRFHCGCPMTQRYEEACFAIVTDPLAMPAIAAFDRGTLEYPDRSTTLIVQVAGLTGGDAVTLTGPGIAEAVTFAPSGVAPDLWPQLRDNHARFPCGVDILFVAGHQIVGLPRSTRIALN